MSVGLSQNLSTPNTRNSFSSSFSSPMEPPMSDFGSLEHFSPSPMTPSSPASMTPTSLFPSEGSFRDDINTYAQVDPQNRSFNSWRFGVAQGQFQPALSHPQIHTHLLKTATHEMLLLSGNPVYLKLVSQITELDTEVRVRKELWNNVTEKINERAFIQNATGALPPPISFAPLQRQQYPLVTIWSSSDWDKHQKSKLDNQTSIQSTKRRNGKNKDKDKVRESMAYVQDENGESILEGDAEAMCIRARSVFTTLNGDDMAPASFGQMSSASLQYYRQIMYAEYPQLRFCDNHFKVNILGRDTFPGWLRTFKSNQKKTAAAMSKSKSSSNKTADPIHQLEAKGLETIKTGDSDDEKSDFEVESQASWQESHSTPGQAKLKSNIDEPGLNDNSRMQVADTLPKKRKVASSTSSIASQTVTSSLESPPLAKRARVDDVPSGLQDKLSDECSDTPQAEPTLRLSDAAPPTRTDVDPVGPVNTCMGEMKSATDRHATNPPVTTGSKAPQSDLGPLGPAASPSVTNPPVTPKYDLGQVGPTTVTNCPTATTNPGAIGSDGMGAGVVGLVVPGSGTGPRRKLPLMIKNPLSSLPRVSSPLVAGSAITMLPAAQPPSAPPVTEGASLGIAVVASSEGVNQGPVAKVSDDQKPFKYNPNSCSALNLFGQAHMQSKPNFKPTKKEVSEAFDALSNAEKKAWSLLRTERLQEKKLKTS